MTSAAATAELCTTHGDDFNASLAQQRVGVDIAVVGHDDAGCEGDHIVAVVPLLARRLISVSACLDDAQLLDPDRTGNDIRERRVVLADLVITSVTGWIDAVTADLVHDLPEQRHQIAVAETENR